MTRFYVAAIAFLICMTCPTTSIWSQTPGFYFGPRFALGQTHFTGLSGFQDGLALQMGVSCNKQLQEQIAIQFHPYIGVYNGQRQNGEADGTYPNGTRRIQTYKDKYNIYSVEFPLYVKFSGGFRKVRFGFFGGPSLGFLIGGMRSKIYDDPTQNAKSGYSGHGMETLKRGMYGGDFGVSAELKASWGLMAIDFRFHHNFSPLGSLEHQYFSADTKTVGVAWLFDTR